MIPEHTVQEAGDRFPLIEDDRRLSPEERDVRLAGAIVVAEYGAHKATKPWPLEITPDEAIHIARLLVGSVPNAEICRRVGCSNPDVNSVRAMVQGTVRRLQAVRAPAENVDRWLEKTLNAWRTRYAKCGVRLEATNGH